MTSFGDYTRKVCYLQMLAASTVVELRSVLACRGSASFLWHLLVWQRGARWPRSGCAPHAVSIPLLAVPPRWRSGAEGDPQPAQMCCSWCWHPAAAEANLGCRAPIAVGDAQSRKNSLRLRAQMSLWMSGHRNHLLVSGA